MEEEVLKLGNILNTKEQYKLKFQSTISDFTTSFDFPLELNPNRNYEFGIKRFSVYNTLFNITASNNKLVYSLKAGKTQKSITIPEGAYEHKQLNNRIQQLMKDAGDYDKTNIAEGSGLRPIENPNYISISVDEPTSKTILKINKNIAEIDFSASNSIGTILGFNAKKYSAATNLSENIIKIELTNDIDIHCSLITCNSFINGKLSDVMMSISAYSVNVGAKIIVSEIFPVYLPIKTRYIDNIRFRITDDNNIPINFSGETITIDCILKQV